MKSLAIVFVLIFIAIFMSCTEDKIIVPTTVDHPNILLIIADDLGKDAISGYAEGSVKGSTPHLDSLRNSGITFDNLWVYPTCTPTRASILTGKYGYRTGIKWASEVLDPSELSLQKYINNTTNNSYATAVIGKWHLSGNNNSVNPESFGIDHYEGLIRGTMDDYFEWQLTQDGVSTLQTEYATEVFTDLSIDWLAQQSKPWFLWLAYNAPHTPFHVPPNNMHNQGNLPAYVDGMDGQLYYTAAIEAMDFQIGRLLANISEEARKNTVIIFIGDNGTPSQVAQLPYSSNTVKGTLFQGGINVPMFVSGSHVSRMGRDNNLINSTDIFATVAELAGVSVDEINDSKSFKSLLEIDDSTLRDFQYSEVNDGNKDQWTISNGLFKLIENANGNKQLYNLLDDPYEENDLLIGTLTSDQALSMAELEDELLEIRN